MYKPDRTSNYDTYPHIHIQGHAKDVYRGYENIVQKLKEITDGVIVFDFYHGVQIEDIYQNVILPLQPTSIFNSEEAKIPEKELYPLISKSVGDDRVFASMSTHTIKDFYDPKKVEQLRQTIQKSQGLSVIYGIGASYVYDEGTIVYFDLERWEIQKRYRDGLDNWGVGNFDEDILRKYKRGYFLEWRVLDRHKFSIFDKIAYYVDAKNHVMITKDTLDTCLEKISSQPFRLIPYFDEGIWGGKWMEEVCGLEHKKYNYAWCFDGVPEENGIGFEIDGTFVDMPAMNLVKRHPKALLGPKVFSRFGAEFPIRFDFLDTMDGGNLSLQVHPLTEYIKENFGMQYTQDESYYILDAKEDAHVYLGLKEGVKKEEFLQSLEESQTTGTFDDTKFINRFDVKKHDHLLIPAGTIHASGANAMVLEISATPYIFTFKLWDWGRVGLDGIPRPINIERGKANIQWDRTTNWVKENLVSPIQTISQDNHTTIEKTGLHELEFIETVRYWFDEEIEVENHESVNMLNLVEGEEVTVCPINDAFDEFVVHYAETFIVPSCIKKYTLKPTGLSKGKKIGVIQAFVKV